MKSSFNRSRWAAIGAVVAVCLGAGGIGVTQATTSSGERAIYQPIEPCRMVDTRPAPFTVGPRTAPLGAAETFTLSGWGSVGECTLPSGTTGLSLNVTAIDQTLPTFLTLFPAAGGLPNASHLNPVPGQPATPNAVNVDLDAAGMFSVYNLQGNVNVIIDVVGYYEHHTHDDRYYTKLETYTKAEVDDGFVNTEDDTFYYVPGALLEIHYDDGPAEVRIDNSGDAIVRKTGSPGDMDVIIPVPLPAELGGNWAKLVDVRVSYRVDNPGSYIDHTWLTKSSNTGAHIDVAQSSADRTSTAYTSYVVGCTGPGCQLSWVPNGNYLTVGLGLRFAGIGASHEIVIGGVLLRVSYDG